MDIFLTDYGHKCSRRGGRLLISSENTVRKSVPLIELSSITLMTGAHISSSALTWCYQNNIPVLFLNRSGKLICHILPDGANRIHLRVKQYSVFRDQHWRCQQVRALLNVKLGQHFVFAREKGIVNKARQYQGILKSISRTTSINRLRGLEGCANKLHYEIIREIIPGWLHFEKRIHRHPRDPMNIILSFLYTVLYRFTIAALTLTGLDPWLGFYHEIKPGHRACASDVMEPFRLIIVDRIVTVLLRKKQITEQAFVRASGGYQLTREGYALLLAAFHKRMTDRRSYAGESLSWMEILRKECFHLSAAVRNTTSYHPLEDL